MDILASLGINPIAVIWHTVNFLLLLLILQRFLYKPILRMLDERSNRIRENLTHAEQVRGETERLKREAEEILSNTFKEAQDILARRQREAEQILAEARQVAREEAQLLLTQAQAEIAQDRDKAFAELRGQIADLVVLAAAKVISRSLDDAAHRGLIEEFLADRPNGQSASAEARP